MNHLYIVVGKVEGGGKGREVSLYIVGKGEGGGGKGTYIVGKVEGGGKGKEVRSAGLRYLSIAAVPRLTSNGHGKVPAKRQHRPEMSLSNCKLMMIMMLGDVLYT